MKLADSEVLDAAIALLEDHSWQTRMPDTDREHVAELVAVLMPLYRSNHQARTKREQAKKPAVDKGSQHRARTLVAARSGGLCEVCALAAAREWHHRKNRSQGGTWAASNGMHLCAADHAWITEHPAEAARNGWTVLSHQGSAEVPLLRRGVTVWLDDEGGVTAVEGTAA